MEREADGSRCERKYDKRESRKKDNSVGRRGEQLMDKREDKERLVKDRREGWNGMGMEVAEKDGNSIEKRE